MIIIAYASIEIIRPGIFFGYDFVFPTFLHNILTFYGKCNEDGAIHRLHSNKQCYAGQERERESRNQAEYRSETHSVEWTEGKTKTWCVVFCNNGLSACLAHWLVGWFIISFRFIISPDTTTREPSRVWSFVAKSS